MSALNLNHKTGTISTDTDNIVKIGEKGAILLTNGEYLVEESDVELTNLIGAMRYNKDRKKLQVFDGKVWREVNGEYEQTSHIIWSLIF